MNLLIILLPTFSIDEQVCLLKSARQANCNAFKSQNTVHSVLNILHHIAIDTNGFNIKYHLYSSIMIMFIFSIQYYVYNIRGSVLIQV